MQKIEIKVFTGNVKVGNFPGQEYATKILNPNNIINDNDRICLIPYGLKFPHPKILDNEIYDDYLERILDISDQYFFRSLPKNSNYMDLFAQFMVGIKEEYQDNSVFNFYDLSDLCFNGYAYRIGNTWFWGIDR